MSSKIATLPTKIRYRYQIDETARLHVAHGVWGGINSQGEIEINFYHESDTLPSCSEQQVAADGSIGPEVVPGNEEVRDITRYIHSRVVINYHTAYAMIDWLQERLAALEEDSPSPLCEADTNVEQ
jgi:hypothetical protein